MQIGTYRLRPADNRDLSAVWDLIHGILAGYGLPMDARTMDKDLKDIEANYWNSKGMFFVLLDADQVIGTVAIHYESDNICELCRMYLDAAYRGKGLGRGLLNFAMAEAHARGFGEMFLKTASVLKEAIALYARAGFIQVDEIDPDGNCDVRMQKILFQ